MMQLQKNEKAPKMKKKQKTLHKRGVFLQNCKKPGN
jgi:hypothetical protein